MCIICNVDGMDGVADEFLMQFALAQKHMKAAASAMLECSRHANSDEARKRYDATHKTMARYIRDWNKLEEMRENHVLTVRGATSS